MPFDVWVGGAVFFTVVLSLSLSLSPHTHRHTHLHSSFSHFLLSNPSEDSSESEACSSPPIRSLISLILGFHRSSFFVFCFSFLVCRCVSSPEEVGFFLSLLENYELHDTESRRDLSFLLNLVFQMKSVESVVGKHKFHVISWSLSLVSFFSDLVLRDSRWTTCWWYLFRSFQRNVSPLFTWPKIWGLSLLFYVAINLFSSLCWMFSPWSVLWYRSPITSYPPPKWGDISLTYLSCLKNRRRLVDYLVGRVLISKISGFSHIK